MKKYLITVLTMGISLLMASGVFAGSQGQWRMTKGRWWYQFSDGSYPAGRWEWINGKWYYFDSIGYMMENAWIDGKYYVGSSGAMLVNTITPDGYRVGEDGAWIDYKAAPVPPSKYITDRLEIGESIVYQGKTYYGFALLIVSRYAETETKIIDRGDYYEVANVSISLSNGSSDDAENYSLAESTTVFVRKNALVEIEEEVLTAEELYSRTGQLTSYGYPFDSASTRFDSKGYIVSFTGFPFG